VATAGALAQAGHAVRIVLVVRSHDAALAGVHRDFHLSAGADAVVASGDAAEGDADWVIDGKSNEFWWPRGGGSLKDVLASVPARYGSVQAVVRHLVPASGEEGSVVERTIYRLSPNASLDNAWRPIRRFVRRSRSTGPPLRGWYPIEVLQLVTDAPPPFTRDALERGCADGLVQVDTRLRDALRAIGAGRSPEFPRPDVLDEAEFALDVAALGEADVLQAHVRLDELEARLAAVESTLPEMVKRKLRTLARRSGRT